MYFSPFPVSIATIIIYSCYLFFQDRKENRPSITWLSLEDCYLLSRSCRRVCGEQHTHIVEYTRRTRIKEKYTSWKHVLSTSIAYTWVIFFRRNARYNSQKKKKMRGD